MGTGYFKNKQTNTYIMYYLNVSEKLNAEKYLTEITFQRYKLYEI